MVFWTRWLHHGSIVSWIPKLNLQNCSLW